MTAAEASTKSEWAVVVESEAGFTNTVRVGTLEGGRIHQLVADEPPAMGGDDEGPAPYEFPLTALGACTSMTLRMYANRKSWPLEGVVVRLRHGRVHAKDCEDCETPAGFIDLIEREIVLRGDLDDEQRTRLLEIADKCPVHKTLTSETKIRTSVV